MKRSGRGCAKKRPVKYIEDIIHGDVNGMCIYIVIYLHIFIYLLTSIHFMYLYVLNYFYLFIYIYY